ncbi:MAG: hypothetical protein H7175_17575 [Burkholderiales bacterium]|nr:hypothetical protein [Anaerolineae bacterium]
MADQRSQELLAYYQEERVNKQLTFYVKRAKKDGRMDLWMRVGAGLLLLFNGLLATILGISQGQTINAQNTQTAEARTLDSQTLEETTTTVTINGNTILAVLLVVIPALSTGLLSIRSLYQFESTKYLFEQTKKRLRKKSNEPLDPNDQNALITRILEIEEIIAAENQQWLATVSEEGSADDINGTATNNN